ncbi:MAG: cobalamin biosynthesis protein CbiD [Firmicutes bacterium]|nr:cobalamin biosynthesis protein CbiD [Bacillota bacterium]
MHDGRLWRRGVTTGACAAAAAKGAAIYWYSGRVPGSVTITLPGGQPLSLPISQAQRDDTGAACAVVKDGGDDPDVTSGLAIWARVSPQEKGIDLDGGPGVGRVTKPGLPIPVGEAAINPVPREMIRREVAGAIPADQGVKVTIFVPEGEVVARRTLNSRLGIVGGISILGTTGIVEPMSEEAFKTSLVSGITVALAHGHETIVLTPGRQGFNWATRVGGVPVEAVVECSNFVGYLLQECVRLGVKQVILWGHIGKLIKVAGGIFHTHNRVADARLEILAAHCARRGLSVQGIQQILTSATLEGTLPVVEQAGLLGVFDELAALASQRARSYCYEQLEVGTVFLNSAGQIIGCDEQAVVIGRQKNWRINYGLSASDRVR